MGKRRAFRFVLVITRDLDDRDDEGAPDGRTVWAWVRIAALGVAVLALASLIVLRVAFGK